MRVVRAPGRVNLIGEHTDYNLGFVMPVAIGLEVSIRSNARADRTARFTSAETREMAEFDLDAIGAATGKWIDHIAGMAFELTAAGVSLRGVDAEINSTIPVGAGLASSAALEIAAAWTLAAVTPPTANPLDLARAAQRSENHYVGVASGLMDEFAVTHGRADHALFLDCRSNEYTAVPLAAGYRLVAIDTRVEHRLSASEYNARRAQCERGVLAIAARNPGVSSLRDVTLAMLDEAADLLDDQTYRRCRHVVDENERVIAACAALEANDMATLGALLAASHASLRDLYEVSSPELDALVEIAQSVPGVVGARMTGAGFGGCTVNVVTDDAIERLRSTVALEYPRRAGREPGFYLLDAVDAAGLSAGGAVNGIP
jgi:galactokinase